MQVLYLKSRAATEGGKKSLHAPEFNTKLAGALKELMPTSVASKLAVYFVVEGLHEPEAKNKSRIGKVRHCI